MSSRLAATDGPPAPISEQPAAPTFAGPAPSAPVTRTNTARSRFVPAAYPTSFAERQRNGRGYRRTPHRVPCRLRWREARGQSLVSAAGQTIDISDAGLAVQIGREPPVGAEVEAVLPQRDGTRTAHGVVVRTRRVLSGVFEIGIRFA